MQDQLKTLLLQAGQEIFPALSTNQVQTSQQEQPAFGEYSTNVAFIIAKQMQRSPSEVAAEMVSKLVNNPDVKAVIDRIEVAGGGFINFFLTDAKLLAGIGTLVEEGDESGKSRWGSGQRWLIEHTSPNPNKSMHLGHLRNNVFAMAVSNLWQQIGVEVVRDAIDNNRGIAIAKLMWGYLKFARKDRKELTDINYWYHHQDEWQTPPDPAQPDRFVDKLYVQGSADFEQGEDIAQQIQALVVNWEAREPATWALWECVLKYSYDGQRRTLNRLGSKWDYVWHEHEIYQQGKDLVAEGLSKGIFRQLADGAVLTNLADFGLTDTILLRGDGTALYITQDIALTKLKREKFNPQRLFWVVGPEQSLALKQVYAICDQLGIGRYNDYTHLSFGYMSLKGAGKMSSRKGNVVYIDDLLDQVKQAVTGLITSVEFTPKERDLLAEKVALGAVKYSILRVGRTTDIAFDLEESVSLEGNSGPYLQYTYARCQSVLAKSVSAGKSAVDLFGQLNSDERLVARQLNWFGEVVVDAATNDAPNVLCQYLYELAQSFNHFYHQHQILAADTPSVREQRLQLTQTTGQVLKTGLRLLGIEAVERM